MTISNKLFSQLEKGDHIDTIHGVMVIQYFGRFENGKWRKSSRKNANGVYIWEPNTNNDGYMHRSSILTYLPAPIMTRKDYNEAIKQEVA